MVHGTHVGFGVKNFVSSAMAVASLPLFLGQQWWRSLLVIVDGY